MNTDQLENLLPVKYRWLIGAAVVLIPIIGRAYHAVVTGGGLKGIWTSLVLGTNVPKDVPTDAQPKTVASVSAGKIGLIVVAGMLAFGILGCGGAGKLAPGGAYAPLPVVSTNADTGIVTTNQVPADYLLFQADSTFMVAYNIADAAFLLERNNRAFFWKISPDIKHSLDLARPKALATRNAYFKARDVYVANPSALALGVLNLYGSQMQTIQASTDSAMSVVTNSVAPVQ